MNNVPDQNSIEVIHYGLDVQGVFSFLSGDSAGGGFGTLLNFLNGVWNVYSIVAILLSILFFIGFMYAKIKIGELSAIEQANLKKAEVAWAERYGGVTIKNSRWEEIEHHIREDNPNSWRVAIIEADIFLEEILNEMGYVGTTIGEKLKSANPASFTTLQDAWEAHKVRNEIAHTGGDFVLTRKVAQETITRFERVFREFGAI